MVGKIGEAQKNRALVSVGPAPRELESSGAASAVEMAPGDGGGGGGCSGSGSSSSASSGMGPCKGGGGWWNRGHQKRTRTEQQMQEQAARMDAVGSSPPFVTGWMPPLRQRRENLQTVQRIAAPPRQAPPGPPAGCRPRGWRRGRAALASVKEPRQGHISKLEAAAGEARRFRWSVSFLVGKAGKAERAGRKDGAWMSYRFLPYT
ncbi:hypothetical protein JDV02_005201 [Purpureocillium takamizusanense]|uniref:Uncharacterized protein n=1 Tax=Purpureocillium takamizusanense TaxID=2060973 RepID=A0A9Q8QG21_9HYPO|nr:uncharacterized protein JDV02_005201 [Purpureocillium takamizusanense]UNI18975.1 hypothetical protein JDV02_005201 [Purpureocillium takamizusanense]